MPGFQPATQPAKSPAAWRQSIAYLSLAGGALLDLFFPPRCCGCGKLGAFLCPGCLSAVEPPPPRPCTRCGAAAVVDFCPTCRSSPLDGVVSAALFQAPIRPAIHALKYDGVTALARPLAQIMAPAWRAAGLPAGLLVPVALHDRRTRERGYNQSALLARELGRELGLEVHADWVTRQRHTLPQVGLGHAERHANVTGAFAASPSAGGHTVVLIDDVCTTGATLEACAAALKAAGAASVWGFTLARARWDGGAFSDAPPGAASRLSPGTG